MTATVAPAGAKVTYSWAVDGETVVGADDETFEVEGEMLGSVISVTVTAADGKTATATTAAVIDALELVSADQDGAKVIVVTANGQFSKADKITVKKGSNDAEVEATVFDENIATVTLKDKIVSDVEYTVTLTPANEDPASSVTFIGEKAELIGIEFMSENLVMKDYHYNEGYAYVKGVDQYGDPVNLSGLTVTPGVGTFKSYDSNTGKITLYDDDYDATKGGTGAYLLVQQVPVYVQYQSGTQVFTANKTLTVSTASFVDNIEFGAIKKDGGSERPDKKLTVTELSSGKYYVELNKVEDQWGNPLSAEDLNYQKDISKTLFVIPGTTGAFYTTGDFGEVGGKTVLWIADGIRPGSMDLSITGAGGETFSLPIVVEDDPYIKTLEIVWPELYEGMTESTELEFSATDQYGIALSDTDLWNLRPVDTGSAMKVIRFQDPNHMTTQTTTITANGDAWFNPIRFDYAKKAFHVTVNAGNTKAKNVETFTVQTAGLDIKTKQITVGSLGYAAKIKSALKSGTNTQLVSDAKGAETSLNFNEKLLFEDANGNEMVRGKSELYPAYTTVHGCTVSETIPKSGDDAWKNGWYVWSLTDSEVKEKASSTAVDYTKGIVEETDFGRNEYLDVYATLYLRNGGTLYRLDSKKFHLTKVTGNDRSFEVVNPGGLLYATPTSKDSATFKVKVTTDQGETYTAAPNRVDVVTSDKFVVDKGTVKCGPATEFDGGTADTLKVTVYCGNKEVGEGTIDYSNKTPVPTQTAGGVSVPDDYIGTDGDELSRTGQGGPTYDNNDFTTRINGRATVTVSGETYTVYTTPATFNIGKDGEFTIKDVNDLGDTLKHSIQDQYGQNMASTGWFMNGVEIVDGTMVPCGRNVFEYRNGDVQGKFYLTSNAGDRWETGYTELEAYNSTITVEDRSVGVETEVTTSSELIKALKAAKKNPGADVITVGGDFAVNAAIEIPVDDALVIPYGMTVTTTYNVTNNGTIRGSEEAGSNADDTTGTFTIDGNGLTTSPKFTNNSVVDLPGNSLELIDAVVSGAGVINGHIVIGGDVIFDADSAQALVDGTQISMANPAATMTVASELTIVGGVDGSEPADNAAITLESSTGTETKLNTGAVESAMTLSDIGADEKPTTGEGDFLVATPDDFIEAINLADAIILAHDIDLSESAIAKNIFTEDTTIDLNGFDLKVAEDHSIWVSGAELTLTDESEGHNGSLTGSADQSAITAMNTGLKKAALVVDPDCLGTNASLGTYFFADQEGAAKPVVTLTSDPSADVVIKASAFSTVVELNDTEVIDTLNADTERAAAPVAVYVESSALSLNDENSTWTAGETTANKEYRADLTVTVPAST